jgi:hypothetical protein
MKLSCWCSNTSEIVDTRKEIQKCLQEILITEFFISSFELKNPFLSCNPWLFVGGKRRPKE